MQDFNTIIGVIQMRQNECSFSVIQKRYHIGSGTTQRILSRFEASGLTLEELRSADPRAVEELFYPPEQVRRKDVPLPDFQYYYDRIHAKGSKVNMHIAERNSRECGAERSRSGISGLFFNQYISLIIR